MLSIFLVFQGLLHGLIRSIHDPFSVFFAVRIPFNPLDASEKGIKDGEMVKLSSARGECSIRARITNKVKPGVLSTTFHFPDIMVNNITSDELDTEADCPEYKVIAVDVFK